MGRWFTRSLLLALGAAAACGPAAGTGEASESGSGTTGDSDGESGTSAADASSTAGPSTGGSTGDIPFACERGEELVPGLCFERYPVELPGAIVGDRATGANIDAQGGDELVIEAVIDDQQRLVVLGFDRETGTTLRYEAEPTIHPDLDDTILFAADVVGDEGEEVFRTVQDGLNQCGVDASGSFVCESKPSSGVENLKPAIPVRLNYTSLVRTYLISRSADDLQLGLDVYRLGSAAMGSFAGAKSSPPCEDPIAIDHGDFNGDGFVDIVHHSSTACVPGDDPRRDDVNVLKGIDGNDFDVPAPADADVEPVLLVVIDVDGDELDDVVVHEPARGEDGYRLLRSEGDRFSAATPLPGPAGTQSLHAARFQRDGSLRLVYAGAEQTAIATRNHDDYDALDPSIGHLLAVLDVDGDGRDDLLLAGPSQRELTLLVVTD